MFCYTFVKRTSGISYMCYVGRSIGWLDVGVVGDVTKGSSSLAPPSDALWN